MEESNMAEKRFLLPWERKYTIACPKCGGRIETLPLWYWERQPDKTNELQARFCHAMDPEFLERVPVLTENDWQSKQRWSAFLNDLKNGFGVAKTSDGQDLLTIKNGLPEIFSKHGIFSLIPFFTETELKALFLFLCIEPGIAVKQVWFQIVMEISRPYVSTILKKLFDWRLILALKGFGEGKARGRQLVYTLTDDARKTLDQDLQNHTFFHEAVVQTVRPIVERFSTYSWRKDLVKPNG